jgi:hypothetical protein
MRRNQDADQQSTEPEAFQCDEALEDLSAPSTSGGKMVSQPKVA